MSSTRLFHPIIASQATHPITKTFSEVRLKETTIPSMITTYWPKVDRSTIVSCTKAPMAASVRKLAYNNKLRDISNNTRSSKVRWEISSSFSQNTRMASGTTSQHLKIRRTNSNRRSIHGGRNISTRDSKPEVKWRGNRRWWSVRFHQISILNRRCWRNSQAWISYLLAQISLRESHRISVTFLTEIWRISSHTNRYKESEERRRYRINWLTCNRSHSCNPNWLTIR